LPLELMSASKACGWAIHGMTWTCVKSILENEDRHRSSAYL
jgi:hypothetical protein